MKKLWCIIIFIVLCSPIYALEYVNSPLVSGIYEDVVVKDNTAYLATQWCVMVLDITNQFSPEVVNIVPFPMAYYLGIQGDLLIASTPVSSFEDYDDRTAIYGISNPERPILLSEIEESARRFLVRDTLLFMQTQEFVGDELNNKLKIFSISDVYSPRQIVEIDSVKSFETSGDYLYTANTISTETEIHLSIYDITDITNVMFLDQIELPITNTSNNDPYILIDNDIMYITESNSYYILNIENPRAPAILSYTENPGLIEYRNECVKYQNYLFVDGGKIIDISDPATPFIAGNYDPPWPPGDVITSIYIYNDNLYVTNWEYGYYFMDITNPLQPVMLYCDDSSDYYLGINIEDDRAYVSSAAGVTILDISNPGNCYVLGSYPYLDWSEDIYTENDLAYVACEYGLVVLDISDPANIQPIGDHHGCLTGLVKDGNYVFGVDNTWGILESYDVSNPANIQCLDNEDFMQYPNALCLQEDLLFVADANFHTYVLNYNGGLRIIDVSDPWDLDLISTINPDTTRYFRSVAVKDSYVFMGSNEPDIYVFDVSDPAQPLQINYIDSQRPSYAMEVKDDYLFNGVQIFDVSDINNIIEIDSGTSVGNPGIPWDIEVQDNYIFEASTYAVSVYVTDAIVSVDEVYSEDHDATVWLSQNFPNPFHERTNIKFAIKERAKVHLSIYNIKGEKVAAPINEIFLPGTHTIEWNGRTDGKGDELPNGVYLYKVEAGDDLVVKKLLLLR